MQPFAPGMRVVIRNEEWLIRRVDPSTDDGYLLRCDGLSELVSGKEALFLSALEGPIEIQAPEATSLVQDSSDKYASALLFLESQRRRGTPNDDYIRLGHRGVMNLAPYQLDPALQALRQPRSRILIADAVGLGKTLESGILATELIQRGRGKRILVVTQKSMLTQFQKEWWSRFSIPLVRLDSVGLARVRNRIPVNHNPFNFFDRSIISMDTLKNNLEYRNYLGNAWWDIIVIDECHNVAARAADTGMSRRARLARLLATRSDTLILLSATPHDGSARSFASLMSLLDPTAISDPDDYTPDDFKDKGLVVRRFKKDIRGQVAADFQERITACLRHNATLEEENAYESLLRIPFTQSGKHNAGKPQELQRIGMQKAMFSSPFAALESTEKRIALLERKNPPSVDEQSEISALEEFAERLRRINAGNFSKYHRLLTTLRDPATGWKATADDRLVIFSERIETLRWLERQLGQDLGLKDKQIAILHGQMTDTEQQDLVERFGREDDPIRVLLCSDVASEGLNLHYFCHRLIHFDLPWSLMVFQQRNGRVDRYGQKHQPQIVYLFTETEVDKIKGDYRILEILQRKDEQANFNLGDPAAFLNVYDPDKEVDKVSDLMASGQSAEAVEAQLDAAEKADDNEGDWLLQLFGGGDTAPEASATSSLDAIRDPVSLFGSDYAFARTALTLLSKERSFAQWSHDDAESIIRITAPLDLRERLRQLPREVQDANGRYTLCADPARMADAIEQARQAKAEEASWPQLHYLWPQHPIVEWLLDQSLRNFRRQEAPVIRSSHLRPGEMAFILMGLIPNRKGQSLVVEWQVATHLPGAPIQLETYEDFIQRARLFADTLPNSGQAVDLQPLHGQLPEAIKTMRKHMVARQGEFATAMDERLERTLTDLKRLQGKQIQQLELRLEKLVEGVRESRRAQRTQQIHRVFDEYRQWVEDTLTTEPEPYIRVLAAVHH
jgi:superfamily II DNA or RNA helicase